MEHFLNPGERIKQIFKCICGAFLICVFNIIVEVIRYKYTNYKYMNYKIPLILKFIENVSYRKNIQRTIISVFLKCALNDLVFNVSTSLYSYLSLSLN